MATEPRDDQCRKALDFVSSFIDEHWIAPSYPEIGRAMGLRSKSSVHAHIRHLVSDGLVVVQGARGVIPTKYRKDD